MGSTTSLKVERVSVHQLEGYPDNPRRGNVDAIAESLETHGQYRPLTVQRSTGYVLAGNHTLEALKQLGRPKADVVYVDADDEQARKIVLADNRTSDLGGYDADALAKLLEQVGSDLTGTGYSNADYTEALNRATAQDDIDEADLGDKEPEPITKRGDLYILGDHQLVCGDSTDPETVRRLDFEDGADIVWTDPPYGVAIHEIANARADRDWTRMAGDDINADAVGDLVEQALRNAHAVARPGAAIYVAHADQMREPVVAAFKSAGWSHRQTLVWVKNTFALGRQDYQWQHEPILYGWREGETHRWYGGFDGTTVIDRADREAIEKLEHPELVDALWELLQGTPGTVVRFAKPSRSVQHPTMKPVELVARHLRNSSAVGSIVFDPFGGGGSTLIAAEQVGRRARLVELEPHYCDGIVARWEQLTGQAAERRPANG